METRLISIRSEDRKQILSDAANLLKQGEIVAFPTETVYGLAAPVFNEKSVEKIYRLKSRPKDNPLIVHIDGLDWMEEIVQKIPSDFFTLAKTFFPGPLTIILNKHPNIPSIVSAHLSTIAVRMPSHPVARELIQYLGQPVVAPSANYSGKPSPTRAEHVLEDFDGKIPLILDGGECEHGIESTVICLATDKPIFVRQGVIPKKDLEKVLGKEIVEAKSFSLSHRFPSMRYQHYASRAKVILFDNLDEIISHIQTQRTISASFYQEKITM